MFGTKLGHYGVRGVVPSEPKIIPDVLPIERSYDTIKKVPLPSSRGESICVPAGSVMSDFRACSDVYVSGQLPTDS